MELQERISAELCAEKIGQECRVIIDRQEGDYYIGRTEHDSPEVDCEVLIPAGTPMTSGSFHQVRITGADEYDLYAEVINA